MRSGSSLPGARVDEKRTEPTDDAPDYVNDSDVIVIFIVIFMLTPWIFVNQEGGV
jgi:hypothetical protein